MDLHLTSLITVFTLLLLSHLSFNVSRARQKYQIHAPATSGHPKFDLVYRVQMKTIENALIFLPALWLFSWYVSPLWGAVLGGTWLVGRIWYAAAYSMDAKKRAGGFILSLLACTILIFGALFGILRQLI